MSPTSASAAGTRSRRIVAALLILDAFIFLFPPLHWAVGSLGPAGALGYVFGGSLVVLMSLFVMAALDRREGEE